MADQAQRLVDLSHVIEHGMTTYKGLPGPEICDFWSREQSAEFYAEGARFQIGRIDTLNELEYFRQGGILHYVLRNLARGGAG